MRLLFMTDPVSRREIDSWVNQQDDDSIQAHKEALAQLCALRILVTPGACCATPLADRGAGLNVSCAR